MTWNDQTEKDVKKVREKLGLNQLENEVPLSAMLSMEQPVLVTADSNVSGKMYLAAELEKFHSIGMDAVASACNELYAMQARPLRSAWCLQKMSVPAASSSRTDGMIKSSFFIYFHLTKF